MNKKIINRRLFIAGAAAGMVKNTTAQTNDFPSGPIRIVLPFTAGGGPDINARLIAQFLTKQTGVSAVVENRTGANGIIASQVVATASPNGNTLLYTTGSHAINPSIYKKLPYDTVADFAPVSLINVSPCLVLVVAPNYSARTFADFIRIARQPDSRISFGSPGIGNTLHLAGELLNLRAKIKMLHVPYKGASLALNATMSGEVQATFLSTTAAVIAVRSGQVRPLAVTSAARLPALPDVPTIAENGFPGFDYDGGWSGMLAPAKTPPAMVARLSVEINKILQLPEVKAEFEKNGNAPYGTTPAEFSRFIDANIQKFATIVRDANIKVEGA
jgi:tripartite-type tricarboxylate transporter receptor subunit TctC